MTVIEVMKKYGSDIDGYVDCQNCPIFGKCFDEEMSGYYDCWEKIRAYLNRKEAVQVPAEMREVLDGILCDINPAEIAAQIQEDNLGHWCKTIREEILKKVSDSK